MVVPLLIGPWLLRIVPHNKPAFTLVNRAQAFTVPPKADVPARLHRRLVCGQKRLAQLLPHVVVPRKDGVVRQPPLAIGSTFAARRVQLPAAPLAITRLKPVPSVARSAGLT